MPVTVPDSVVARGPREGRPLPGLLVVFSRERALFHPAVLPPREALPLGRDGIGGLCLADERMSTRHAEVRWEPAGFTITDLGSRNGTFLDGVRVEGSVSGKSGGLLRLGQTLALLLPDLRRYAAGEVTQEGERVIGPTLRRALDQAALARHERGHLLVLGESGAGKELVASHYHQASPRRGPLVTFNCATLQPGLAEARLFGVVKGAFTEAKDTEGLFLQASGGVLFLDEVAELELQVQAKLLRAVETGEVQRVGEATVRKVEVSVVAASHQRLQDRVAAGLFRQDLLFRLRQYEVEVPPLRERLEEVPWVMQLALAHRGPPLHASAVEAALQRAWPGNLRELRQAILAAASKARQEGAPLLKAEHLAPEAGVAGAPSAGRASGLLPAGLNGTAPGGRASGLLPTAAPEPTREQVLAFLEAAGGNVTLAAKLAGLHRTQLNRLRAKHGLMPAAPRRAEKEAEKEAEEQDEEQDEALDGEQDGDKVE